MTYDIRLVNRDGASVVSVKGPRSNQQVCVLLCKCGNTFEKSRRATLNKRTKLRCRECVEDQHSRNATEWWRVHKA